MGLRTFSLSNKFFVKKNKQNKDPSFVLGKPRSKFNVRFSLMMSESWGVKIKFDGTELTCKLNEGMNGETRTEGGEKEVIRGQCDRKNHKEL